MRRFTLILTLVLGQTLAMAQRVELFGSGMAHFSAGNYPEAIVDLTAYIELIKANPSEFSRNSLATAYLWRGRSHSAMGNHKASIDDINEALRPERRIRGEADLADAYLGRGMAYRNLGQNEQALLDITRVVEMGFSDIGSIFVFRGLINGDLERHEEAVEDFSRFLDAEGLDDDTLLDLRLVYVSLRFRGEGNFHLQRYREAWTDFATLHDGLRPEVSPSSLPRKDHAKIHYMMGMSLYHLGMNDQAIGELAVALTGEFRELLDEEELLEASKAFIELMN